MRRIIDLTKDSDTLAFSILDSVNALVARLGSQAKGPYYLVGTGRDFDECCAPWIDTTPNFSGAACLWPDVRKSATGSDAAVVHITQEFVQAVDGPHHLVICQSVASVPEQLVALISSILPKIEVSCITVLSIAIASEIKDGLETYFRERHDRHLDFISLEEIPERASRIDFYNQVLDRLDNRPVRMMPVMPKWVITKMKGHSFNPAPSRTTLSQRSPGLGG